MNKYKQNWNDFRERFVTSDEKLIHYYIPDKKRDIQEWTQPGEKHPKVAKVEKSVSKTMAIFFWISMELFLSIMCHAIKQLLVNIMPI